jgi:hypothetical protein
MAEQTTHEVNANPADGDKPAERAEGGEPAQEWGGRHETGKAIARGGKNNGEVAGAGDGQQPTAPQGDQ